MKLIIEIPDRIHFGIEKGFCVNGSDASQIVLDAIKNGKLLPKGHGDLIDISEITAYKELECNGHNVKSLDEFTTIIEADKE